MYFFLRTIDFKINRLESNPAIPKLKRKLELFIQTLNEKGNNKNPLIISYINSVLALSLQEISSKYRNINSASMSAANCDSTIPLSSCYIKLPDNWSTLRNYKDLPGIYKFSYGKDSYVGSSKNLFKRCFTEHKNNAFTKTFKHIKFYSCVVNNTWNVFTLYILDLTPNHVKIFAKLNPDHILTEIEFKSLQDLTLYELTIAEQIYLDAYKPTLNGSLYANWSSYNIGSTDYIRSEESNQNLSFSNLNRSFNQATIDLHKSNRSGTKASEATKLKMSASHKGRPVTLIDVNTGNEFIFDTVSSLGREIGISDRTINRWALNGKVHKTNSLKYPLIRIKI